MSKYKRKTTANRDGKNPPTDDELIFNLEEEHVTDLMSHSPSFPVQPVSTHTKYFAQTGSLKLKGKSPTKPKYNSVRLEKHAAHVLVFKNFLFIHSNKCYLCFFFVILSF